LVILSHADADHLGGLPAVLRAFPVEQLWHGDPGTLSSTFECLLDRARAQHTRRLSLHRPGQFAGLDLPRNERSLVLRLQYGRFSLLLPGDLECAGESATLAAGGWLQSSVLKLAHHGRNSSSSSEFLGLVSPRTVVASASVRHPPHPAVLERLASLQPPPALFWTGRDGMIRIETDGSQLRVLTFGSPSKFRSLM
jgi:competence protein ComEC